MQRQVTSVFSEYETIDNNSFNSKQLDYWLKQITSPEHNKNKKGYEWTLMSNDSSRFDAEQISFAKNRTVQSNNFQQEFKENNSFLSNNRQHFHSVKPNGDKNKSYLNAMTALQKRIKMLQDQNQYLNKNLVKINQERTRSLSQSLTVQEQLKSRIQILEPRAHKIDELIQENKRVRQIRDEKTRKLKLSQKMLQEHKKKLQELNHLYNQAKTDKTSSQKTILNLQSEMNNLQAQVTRLNQKNRQLQDMRDNSTTAILQKYNTCIETIEKHQKEAMSLKNQIHHLQKTHKQQNQKMKQQQTQSTINYQVQIEKMKQSCEFKDSCIKQKKLETDYFRQVFQKKDQQFLQLMKSQNQIHEKYQKQINQLNNKITKLQQQKAQHQQKNNNNNSDQQKKKQKKYRVQPNRSCSEQKDANSVQQFVPFSEKQYTPIINAQNKSEIIKLPQTIMAVQEQSFNGFQSDEEQEIYELDQSFVPDTETKSQGKLPRISCIKKQKPSALSSVSNNSRIKNRGTLNSAILVTNHATSKQIPSARQVQNNRHRPSQQNNNKISQKSRQKQKEKHRLKQQSSENRQKSRSRSRQIPRQRQQSRTKQNKQKNGQNNRRVPPNPKTKTHKITNNNNSSHSMSQEEHNNSQSHSHKNKYKNGHKNSHNHNNNNNNKQITFQIKDQSQIKDDYCTSNSYLYAPPPPPYQQSYSHWNTCTNQGHNSGYQNLCRHQEMYTQSANIHNVYKGPQNFDQALVIQLQKQLLDLYDQQQNLIQASGEQYVSQSQRSQFFGRLKQINEQLRVKNQKICDIKSRL